MAWGSKEKDVREADKRFRGRLCCRGGFRQGVTVVCDGEAVASVHNRCELDHDPSVHAEFCAMVEAVGKLGCWYLSDCVVYVTLESCLMCAGLMVNSRIDRCVYGVSDPKAGLRERSLM